MGPAGPTILLPASVVRASVGHTANGDGLSIRGESHEIFVLVSKTFEFTKTFKIHEFSFFFSFGLNDSQFALLSFTESSRRLP